MPGGGLTYPNRTFLYSENWRICFKTKLSSWTPILMHGGGGLGEVRKMFIAVGLPYCWVVTVCPSDAGLGNICIYFKIYLCVGYMLQTILWVYVSWIYMLVLDTHHLELFLERSGVGLGNIHFLKYTYIIGYIQFTIWGINVVMKYVMPTVGGWI